jgi:hypothetical protein
MVKLTIRRQSDTSQDKPLILFAEKEQKFISPASGSYDSIIISESDNNPVASTKGLKITESTDLTPEEAEDLRESFREIEEGKYEVFENADDLIREIKSDKD